MKKLASLLTCLLLGWGSISAQVVEEVDTIYVYEYPPVNNILKMSPFHFFDGTFHLSYERFLSDKHSIQISGGIHSQNNFINNEPNFGTQEELQYRYYALAPRNSGEGSRQVFFFKGLFAAPFVTHRWRQLVTQQWDWIAQENVLVDQNINDFSGGVVLGAQIAFGNVFFMDAYFGGGIRRSFGVEGNSNFFVGPTGVGYSGVIPKAGFNIGIGF